MGCEVTITDKIKLKNQSKNSFSSEEEFDRWLLNNADSIKQQLKIADDISSPTFMISVDPITERKTLWDKFREETSNRSAAAKANSLFGKDTEPIVTIGVTKVFKHVGNAENIDEPVSKYDSSKLRSNFVSKQREANPKITESEIDLKWRHQEQINARQALDGTIFGALVEEGLTGNDILSKLDLKQALKDSGLTREQAINRVKDKAKEAIDQIIKTIHSKHGSDAKIFTEVEVISKELNKEFRRAIGLLSLNSGYKQAANAIQGFLDVVVQDNTGQLHTYDIKLSKYKVNDWWAGNGSNAKYDEISAQQMAYATIAKQYGIDFNTIGIIPANVEYDENGEIKSIKKEDFKTFSLTNQYAIACAKYFPVTRKIASSDIIKRNAKLMDELYSGALLGDTIKIKETNKDFVMNNLVREKDGKWYLKFDGSIKENAFGLKPEVVFDSRIAMEKFVEDTYLPAVNETHAQMLPNFASDLRKICRAEGFERIEQLRESVRGITTNKNKQEWIINKFKKYITGDVPWNLVSDEDNQLANNGIFIFVRNGLAEIVMLDTSDLYAITELGRSRNTTILGNLRHDLAKGIDDLEVMPSMRGNLLLMKAMAFISQNETTIFNGLKIEAIRAINMNYMQHIDEVNSKLLDNWNKLASFYNLENSGNNDKSTLRSLDNKTFLTTPLALVQRANDIAETFLSETVHFIGHNEHLAAFSDDSAEDIERYIKNLESAYHISQASDWTKHTDAFEAYMLLKKAQLAIRGFIVSAQNGVGDYISGKMFLTGAKSSSPAESPSQAIRLFNQIETTYEQKLRDTYLEQVRPWQNLMSEVYKEAGIDGMLGNERDVFKECFELDDEGNITTDFRLLPPDQNKYLEDKPKLKALVEMFLEKINELRIPNPEEREQAKYDSNSVYYQVPLTTASFRQQVKQGGFTNAVKQKAQAVFEESKDFVFGKPLSTWEIKKFEDIDAEQIYDPYLNISEDAQEFRKSQLEGKKINIEEHNKTRKKQYAVSMFETSLDTVFLRSMASALRAQVSQEFMPLFTGLRAIIAFNQNVDGAVLEGVPKAIDMFMRSTIFGKLIINPSEQTLYHVIRLLRAVTSKAALAFNTVSFTREQLTSAFRTSINKTVDPLMKGYFTEKDYVDAMFEIITQSPENTDVRSFWMQLNAVTGMANASTDQLAQMSKSGWAKPSNWTQDILFWTATSPDFVHRNAILTAILKHRGSFEAYSLNSDHILEYDMDKDKFYEIFWKNRNRYSELDREDKIKYKTQEGFYLKALEDWNNRYGMNLKYGDKLPQALSPTETNGIRVYADHMFGNYDANTKSLLAKSLLGSVLFQFKTYTLQRFLQSFRGPGYINVTRPIQRTTVDGDPIFVKTSTPAEIGTYGNHRYVTKSEAEKEGINPDQLTPLIDLTGTGTSGKIASNLTIAIDRLINQEKFNEEWNQSEVFRANLYIALFDNLGLLFIAMLLKLMFGEETVNDIYNQPWWTRWSYTVLMGVAQDGPIDQVVSGLVGGGTPPSLAIVKSFFRNVHRVIDGEDSVMYGFMNSFGATRQFAGMFANAR